MKTGDRVEVVKQGLASTGRKGVVQDTYRKYVEGGWYTAVLVSLNNGKTLGFSEESLKVIEDKTNGQIPDDLDFPFLIVAIQSDEVLPEALNYSDQVHWIEDKQDYDGFLSYVEDIIDEDEWEFAVLSQQGKIEIEVINKFNVKWV